MKRLFYFLGGLLFLVVIGWFILEKKLNVGSFELDNIVWEFYIGWDIIVGILLD